MRLSRLIGLGLLLTTTAACPGMDALGNGEVRLMCRRTADGGVEAIHTCDDDPLQRAVCNINATPNDAGKIPGVCCTVGVSRETCAQTAGFNLPTDGAAPATDASGQ